MERNEKQAQFASKPKRGGFLWAIVVLIILLAGTGVWALRPAGNDGEVKAINGRIEIPETTVSDGKAHFFTFRHNDVPIRFFVLKSHDGVIRAAFDACDVCFKEKKGYRQDGDEMICSNCDMRFPSDQINEVKGGCNPAPIERTIADGKIILSVPDLTQGVKYF